MSERISLRDCIPHRWEVYKEDWTSGKWYASLWKDDGVKPAIEAFDTWREAYDHADKQARTTTNGETK